MDEGWFTPRLLHSISNRDYPELYAELSNLPPPSPSIIISTTQPNTASSTSATPFTTSSTTPSTAPSTATSTAPSNVSLDSAIRNPPSLGYSEQNPFSASLYAAQVMTSDLAAKKVLKVILDCGKQAPWPFIPGDSINLYCENDPNAVAFLLQHLSPFTALDEPILIASAASPQSSLGQHLIAPSSGQHNQAVSIKQLLARHFDIFCFPKKACLRDMAWFCKNKQHASTLLHLASREGSSEYMQLARDRTTMLDFLYTFPSCEISLACLLSHLTLLHPRPYSLVNSPLENGGKLEIVFSLMDYYTPQPEAYHRWGICSSWLDRITGKLRFDDGFVRYPEGGEPSLKLEIFPRPTTGFQLPDNPLTPLVLICAGTGIAPFISILRHRKLLSDTGIPSGPIDLFYGIRDRRLDYLYETELNAFVIQGILTNLHLAISREPDSGYPKYVQDALLPYMDGIYEGLVGNSEPSKVLLLCGDELTMIKDVTTTISSAIEAKEGIGPKEAASRLRDFASAKKILKDVWV